MTEKTTGMEVVLTDLLRQSSRNEGGRKEAMFTPHVDNNNDRPKSVLTAICLLTNTKTSMRVCGKQEFVYQNMGHTAIFPSALFHETIFAEALTMKLAMFLHLPDKDKSLKTFSRTTRAQYKAVEHHSPSLSWKLNMKPSFRAHKKENSHDSQGKNYDSDYSELSIVSQDPGKEAFLPVKHRCFFDQARDAYREQREKNEHFSGIQATSTSELTTSPPLRDKHPDKNFLISLEQLGDVSSTNEDIGSFTSYTNTRNY